MQDVARLTSLKELLPGRRIGLGCLAESLDRGACGGLAAAATRPRNLVTCGQGRPHDEVAGAIDDQVAGPHQLDRLTAETLLEVRDTSGRLAPQVVGREVLFAEAEDGGPLDEVVRVGVGPLRGGASVEFRGVVAAGDVEERRQAIAFASREVEADAVRGCERAPDAAVVAHRTGVEAGTLAGAGQDPM